MNLDSIATLSPSHGDLGSEKGSRVPFGPREFFEEFFRRVEQRGIPYVIVHGYEDFPARFSPDVDCVVGEADLPKVAPLLAGVVREHRWVVVQVRQHELFATSCVVIDPENAANHLRFAVCSHSAKRRCLLVRDAVLLGNRRRHASGFFIPAPASEFIFVLATALAEDKPPGQVLPRLRELWRLDPAGAQQRFGDLIGETAKTVQDWLGNESLSWNELAAAMRARNGYGLALRLADAVRRMRHPSRPVGVHIAVLGPNGAGKSTLIQNLGPLLAPCFSEQHVFQFRPGVFDRISRGVNPTRDALPPQIRTASCARILHYFTDWWLGLFFHLLPIQRRGGLVVFEGNFDVVVAEQRRSPAPGVGFLARILRPFVPRAGATFILDAEPDSIHARQPESPAEDLERQRQEYRRLAAGGDRMRLVNAEEPPDEVARKVCREIIMLLAYRERRRSLKAGKRIFDVAVASLALVVLSPLLAILALLVRLKLGTPILFKQERPGLCARIFTICKFRTMTDARDASGELLPDAERLTRFGKLLRSTSLDELPELLNILKGNMSLVGPRPLLVEYLPRYSPEQMRRHDVLPGVTGLAQVNGRNAATWPQKFADDVWYVDHQSLWLDLKIIWLTFWTVLKREGINQPGFTTSENFRGNEEGKARDSGGK